MSSVDEVPTTTPRRIVPDAGSGAPRAPRVPHPTVAERVAAGKAARAATPRSSHAAFEPDSDRPDPIELLEGQAATRVTELVPIRYGRMAVSPLTFYRGAALLQASDLSRTPSSGITVQLCGDAHLSNFGIFASPERRMVFDINDFDETHPGPWEWDVKRLATSLAVAGRERGYPERERRRIVRAAVGAYREAMRDFAGKRNVEVWYARLDVDDAVSRLSGLAPKAVVNRVEKGVAKARTKDSMQVFTKLTHEVDGEPRILADPPLIERMEDLAPPEQREQLFESLRDIMDTYRGTLQFDRRHLLEQFRLVDVARKVVGVGSVGTRAWIALLLGRDSGDPLFLQLKEAQRSVLEDFTSASQFSNCGERVVNGQHLMQAASDIFLGWFDIAGGLDGRARDFYGRQLKDWKGSVDVEQMVPEGFAIYARMCGWTLARAHARSGDRVAIASYLGSGDSFERAINEFAESYADQNERDYQALKDAIKDERIVAVEGL